MRLKDKVALVTGAGGPMGMGVARRFAEEGASLIMTDISGSRLAQGVETVEACLRDGARVFAQRGSVLVESEVDELLAGSREHFDRVDIIVNVVGGLWLDAKYTPVMEVQEERWDMCFTVNMKGIFYLTRKLGPGMIGRQYGKIVNVSSVEYAGAMSTLTALLQELFAPWRYGMSVRPWPITSPGKICSSAWESQRILLMPPCFWPAMSPVTLPVSPFPYPGDYGPDYNSEPVACLVRRGGFS